MRKNRKGFTIAVVLAALFIVLLIVMTLVMRLASHSGRVRKNLEVQAARLLSEAAIVHGTNMTTSTAKAVFADGSYEIVTREEQRRGPLDQKVIHIVTQANTKQGGHTGCLYTCEKYPAGQIVPLYLNRFERKLKLQDDVVVRQLIKGKLITKREERLRKKYNNLKAEMDMSKPDYDKALGGLKESFKKTVVSEKWDELSQILKADKM